MKPRPLSRGAQGEARRTVSDPRNDSDDENLRLDFGNIDDYSVGTRLGRGKYSNVFKGHAKSGDLCVIKVLKPVRSSKIQREISILKDMKGAPHVSQLLDVVRDPASKSIALILNWSNNIPVRTILPQLSTVDIAIYVKSVLEALAFAHERSIMHRDVKPGNIMFDMKTKDVSLVDWGLAEYYVPGSEYPVRVATRHYKGPELLLNYPCYQPSLDIWCLGCTMASLLFAKVPFFRGRDNDEQIVKLSEIFGSDEIFAYARKYALVLPGDVTADIAGNRRKPWSTWVNLTNRKVATDDALDLLDKMLTIDHAMRPSAREALRHPFFDCIKQV